MNKFHTHSKLGIIDSAFKNRILSKHPALSNCLLRGLGKMSYWLAQRSEGCLSESQPRPNALVSQISQNIEISLCISHSESLCNLKLST